MSFGGSGGYPPEKILQIYTKKMSFGQGKIVTHPLLMEKNSPSYSLSLETANLLTTAAFDGIID